MKVSELIKQLTENANGDNDVHIQCDEATFVVTNILVSAAADEGSSMKQGDIILASFATESK